MMMLFSARDRYNSSGQHPRSTDEFIMIRNVLLAFMICSGMTLLGGCSSVMSHTGGKEGTYPGTRASATMIGDDETTGAQNRWRYSTCHLPQYWTQYCYRGMCSAKTAQCARALKKAKPTHKPPMRLFHRPECLITDLAISFGDPQLTVLHPRQPLTIRRENHGVRRRWIGVVFG